MTSSPKIYFPYIIVFFEVATYLSNDMYLPALPSMMRDFSISEHEAQSALIIWFLGSISGQLILGPLSDRFGRKLILCLGALLFMLSTLLCATASSLHTLLIARFFQGTGVCFAQVPGYACIHESFDQKQAIRWFALMMGITVLAPALGPTIGSIVLLIANWRWIFGILVIWSAIATLLFLFWMPETLPPEKRTPLAFKKVLCDYYHILVNPKFLSSMCTLGFIFITFILWIAAGPFIVIDEFGKSALYFAMCQAAIFLIYIIANHSVSAIMEKMSLQSMIHIGMIMAAIGTLFCFCCALLFPKSLLCFVIGFMIFSFSSGFVFSPLNRLAIESTTQPMGSRTAMFSMSLSGFATLSSVLVSLFYDKTLFSIACIGFVATILAVVFDRLRR